MYILTQFENEILATRFNAKYLEHANGVLNVPTIVLQTCRFKNVKITDLVNILKKNQQVMTFLCTMFYIYMCFYSLKFIIQHSSA